MAGRTIRVVGTRGRSNNWIIRESMKKEKSQGYGAMGMKHFSQIRIQGMNVSCHEHLYNLHMKNYHDEYGSTTAVMMGMLQQSEDEDDGGHQDEYATESALDDDSTVR